MLVQPTGNTAITHSVLGFFSLLFSEQNNTSFQFLVLKEHKGIVALAQNGMASARKTTSTVITSYHNQVVLYNIFYYYCNVIITSL